MNQARRDALDPAALSLLLGCCIVWGLGQTATKVALVDIPPLTQAALRSLGALLLLTAWARWRGIRLWERDGTAFGGLLAGGLFASEFACIFIGLQFTAASRMVVFIYLAPFVVAFGMPFIARGERLAPSQWLGLVLAFGGVSWAFAEGFSPPSHPASPQQWIGDALGLAAAVFWGGTTLAIRSTRLSSAAPEKTLAYQLAVSALVLAVAAVAMGEHWPERVSTVAAGALAFQIVVVTFASYLAWFWLMRHYPATRISAFTLLTPVSGLAAGVWILNEPLTLRLATALIAVVLGLALVNRR